MEMNWTTTWWIACGVLVAMELASGTFYLLMLALGCAAGALAAHLGLSASTQMVSAAVVGGAAVLIWHQLRRRSPSPPSVNANPDAHLDIGQSVDVSLWNEQGRAQVKYRGAEWQARFSGQGQPTAGKHIIRGIEGSCLQLDR